MFLDNLNSLDFEYDEESETYYWPCPCGDRFQITKVKLIKREKEIFSFHFFRKNLKVEKILLDVPVVH
jgi:hypothetical protein